ncbi:hypothetical protein Z948_786 [Sulfitobacter donghicola DSW-25 = KCTC 12864 = JCM 14565]|nr:hypothetical protein Z948_786 [Sulfitobacter donghicola DSW-25 = KCTC 12864 = JCM 14565]
MTRCVVSCGWTSDFEQLFYISTCPNIHSSCGWTSDFEQLFSIAPPNRAVLCCGWTSDFEQLFYNEHRNNIRSVAAGPRILNSYSQST